jgi:hypothetical protein
MVPSHNTSSITAAVQPMQLTTSTMCNATQWHMLHCSSDCCTRHAVSGHGHSVKVRIAKDPGPQVKASCAPSINYVQTRTAKQLSYIESALYKIHTITVHHAHRSSGGCMQLCTLGSWAGSHAPAGTAQMMTHKTRAGCGCSSRVQHPASHAAQSVVPGI